MYAIRSYYGREGAVSRPRNRSVGVQFFDDGSSGFVESRRIGNIVYIISRYAPQVPGLIYYPQTDQDSYNFV